MAKRIYTGYDILNGLDDWELQNNHLMHDEIISDDDDTPPYGIPRPAELPDED